MKRIILGIAAIAAGAWIAPASAQAITATLPVTCNASGSNCIQATPVTNPDGTTIGSGGGGGDATAANQATQITAAQLTNTTLGAVTASPTANTIGDRLKVINTTLGTPYQAGGALPLPSGAATSAKQDSIITAIGTPFQAGGSIGNTGFTVSGSVAHDSPYTANPVPFGCYASSSAQPAVTLADIARVWCTLNGATVAATVVTAANADGIGNTLTGFAQAINGTGTASASVFPSYFNGSTWDRMRGDTAGLVTQPYALTASRWQYAAASGGISNTTAAVTIAAAAGGTLRNYVTGMQCSGSTLGAATEFAIRDGAGGTVLWRGYFATTALSPTSVNFEVPIKGTANTLVEVVTLTASITGAVYCNFQGFTAN